jgi:rare lipoprotein A
MKVLRIFNITANRLIIKNIPLFILISFFNVPFSTFAQTETDKGTASYYANTFQGKKTASGEKYDKNKYTAAHRTLAFGTKLKVTNLSNNKTVIVMVNDRGPYAKQRLIDLSYVAAKEIGMINQGIAQVSIEVITVENPPTKITKKLPQQSSGFYNKELHPITRPHGYLLQVGSYSTYNNAAARIEALKSHNIGSPCIQIATVRKKKVYRVLYSGFNTREVASRKKIELNKKKIDCIIIDAK